VFILSCYIPSNIIHQNVERDPDPIQIRAARHPFILHNGESHLTPQSVYLPDLLIEVDVLSSIDVTY